MYTFHSTICFNLESLLSLERYPLDAFLNQMDNLYVIGKSDESWSVQVVGPAVEIVRSFLSEDGSSVLDLGACDAATMKTIERNLWTQYVCKVRTA